MATKAQLAAAQKDIAAQRAKRGAAPAEVPAPKRTRAKPTVQQHVESVQPEAEHVDVASLFGDLPAPSRVVVGLILGLSTAGGVGYGVSCVMSYALAGVLTLTGSVAMIFMLKAAIWVLGIYAGWKLSTWAGSKVFSAVVLPEGLVSQCYASLAGGFGGAKDAVVERARESSLAQRAAQFTGAWKRGDVVDAVVRA